MRRWVLGAVAAVPALLAVPAMCIAAVAGTTRLVITPAHPHPGTTVVVRFRQPTVAERLPSTRIAETLQVTGPARRGCAAGVERSVPLLAAGSAMRETLRPGQLTGGRWCVGVYRVSLEVTQSTSCPIGVARHICPEYIALPRIVGTRRFRVTAR